MRIGLLVIIYISFISLGLPDSLLGAAWPVMYGQLSMPISGAGLLSMVIAGGTIISSLWSAKLIARLGTGKVTAISVAMTAGALLGFSLAPNFPLLCLCAVPLGLGAGAVDSALNNFVALHYQARHMSWLHCFWGLGATAGPFVLSLFLSRGSWRGGYGIIGGFQVVLVAVLLLCLPLWQRGASGQLGAEECSGPAPSNLALLRLPGVRQVLLAFFCYCALESTTGLWAGSYLVAHRGLSAEAAAQWAAGFYLGITLGRFVCGFLTLRLAGRRLVGLGQAVIVLGVAALLLPLPQGLAGIGLFLIGLGCAPIYPSLLHDTPIHFGPEHSQALMGLQMAGAYVGSTLAPPLFGLMAQGGGMELLPVYLLVLVGIMVAMVAGLNRAVAR
ncbi:MAG: MFS transporter [Pseudoflavonifractor sp.]